MFFYSYFILHSLHMRPNRQNGVILKIANPRLPTFILFFSLYFHSIFPSVGSAVISSLRIATFLCYFSCAFLSFFFIIIFHVFAVVVLPIIMSLYLDSPTAFNEKNQLQFIPDVIYLILFFSLHIDENVCSFIH